MGAINNTPGESSLPCLEVYDEIHSNVPLTFTRKVATILLII